tara:strand:+ start:10124 stop:10690 length:567 start_codon:yes stop_codon:yes gene_type:complete
MLKRYSALDNNYNIGKYPFNNSINIKFKECGELNLQQIAFWPNTLSSNYDFLQKQLNIKKLPSFNKGIINSDFSVWRIEPLKFWILDKNVSFSEDLGTTLDISHAFTCLNISGEKSKLLLNRHLPIDLRQNNFQSGSSASSAIHHVSIKLLKFNENNYYLFIPRGFAESIWQILLESSKQFGYQILER